MNPFEKLIEHPFERILLNVYSLDDLKLRRLALFVFAHLIIDRCLAAAVGLDELVGQQHAQERLRPILKRILRRPLGLRLEIATNRRLFSDSSLGVATDVNNARNKFLHSSVIPIYKDKEVTSLDGFQQFMTDVSSFYIEWSDRWNQ